jgi:aminoglycoside phosphotransferase (APT) family kinase protein
MKHGRQRWATAGARPASPDGTSTTCARRRIAAVPRSSPETLTHCDVRADNLLVRPDGEIIFVDWPWAAVGPDWLDTVLLAVNVITHGGDGDRPLAAVDPGHATDVIAGLAGMFTFLSRQPPPPAIPTLRAVQRAQADALLPWLRDRLMGAAAHPGGPGNSPH